MPVPSATEFTSQSQRILPFLLIALIRLSRIRPAPTRQHIIMRVHYILPALLGATTARIVGLAAPSKLAPGSDFQITLITEDYVQSVFDVSAAFGLSPIVFPGTLGTYISSFYIGEGMPCLRTFRPIVGVFVNSFA